MTRPRQQANALLFSMFTIAIGGCGLLEDDKPPTNVFRDVGVKTRILEGGRCDETGGAVEVEVFLANAPSATVTVAAELVQPDEEGPIQATLSSETLVFEPDTWQTPQTLSLIHI